MYNLSVFYLNGTGVPKDAVKAVDLLMKAAKLGNPDAKAAMEKMKTP